MFQVFRPSLQLFQVRCRRLGRRSRITAAGEHVWYAGRVAVDVEPGAIDDESDVLGQVEDGGDKGKADKEEEH